MNAMSAKTLSSLLPGFLLVFNFTVGRPATTAP